MYDPEVVPARGWRWLDRRGHLLARRLDRALFAQFSTRRPSRPGWTPARICLVAISAALVLLPLGCAGLGVWFIAVACGSRSSRDCASPCWPTSWATV